MNTKRFISLVMALAMLFTLMAPSFAFADGETSYQITIEPTTNGSVTADKETAEQGEEVTLAVTPAEGYHLEALAVKDASDQKVTVTNNTFAMPASDVTVSATFEEDAPDEEPEPEAAEEEDPAPAVEEEATEPEPEEAEEESEKEMTPEEPAGSAAEETDPVEEPAETEQSAEETEPREKVEALEETEAPVEAAQEEEPAAETGPKVEPTPEPGPEEAPAEEHEEGTDQPELYAVTFKVQPKEAKIRVYNWIKPTQEDPEPNYEDAKPLGNYAELESGDYHYIITAEGYEPAERDFSVVDELVNIEVTLQEIFSPQVEPVIEEEIIEPVSGAEPELAEKLTSESEEEVIEPEPEEKIIEPELEKQKAIPEPEAEEKEEEVIAELEDETESSEELTEEPEEEPLWIDGVSQSYAVKQDDPDKLFESFVAEQMGKRISSVHGQKSSGAGDGLEGASKVIYQIIAPKIHQIATGERAATDFTFTTEELGLGDSIRWTAEELGVETIQTEDGIVDEFWEKLADLISIGLLFDALREDNPFDLYWIDLTWGISYGVRSLWIDPNENSEWVEFSGIWLGIAVASKYQDGDEYTMNTTIGSSVVAAGNKARAIVSHYASASDYEKLRGYGEEICDLVEYNYDAYEESENGSISSSDPWQIIWVFDEDPTTNVVCEGYAKAFQHLCDLSSFINDIQCISVIGDAGGAHMWNIVRMEDGDNYLVDVTWCDGGNFSDWYFLKGYDSGSASAYPKYVIHGIARTYDAYTMALYGEDKLSLSSKDYEQMSATRPIRFASSISPDTQIALNSYIGQLPDDAVLSEYTAKVFYNDEEISSVSFDTLSGYRFTVDGITSTYYYLKIVELAAKMMTDEYVVKVFCNNKEVAEQSYSIRTYCEARINNDAASAANKALCRATLTYGAEAQKYFQYKTDDLADKNIARVDLVEIPSEYAISGDPTLAGISKVGTSGSFESQVFLNLYFIPEEGYTKDDFTFVVKKGGTTYAVEASNYGSGWIYLRMPSVAAKDLGTAFEITVTNNRTGATATWNRSAMNYAHISQQNSPNMVNLVRAIYQYYLAAK